MFRARQLALPLLLSVFLVACHGAPMATVAPTAATVAVIDTATPLPIEEPTTAPTAAPVLALTGPDGSKAFTLEDLKALPATEGWGGWKSSTGKITPPAYYKGVALQDLWTLVGPFDASLAINVVAKDGYAMTFSYDQIANATFTTFDPATGDEVQRDEKLTVIVAYERDGQPMPEDTDGTLRLAIVSSEKNQVTDGHWSVKWVTHLELKAAVAEWTLHLEGALVEDMDRGTFESGAAPDCHGETWTDADGQQWSGIPLYYLLGRVDDEIQHEGGAYNDELGKQGYLVDVVAADGYKVTFAATRLHRNKEIILANTMNGEPLPEKYFPLRLVGEGLQKSEMVGAVAQIVLHLDALPTVVPTATATGERGATEATEAPAVELTLGTLHIYGAVDQDLALTQADLQQIGLVTASVEHPKKGLQDYEGVRLVDLLQQAGPAADATTAVLTAGDGYRVELALADVLACADCLVVPEGEGFNLAMPGFESSAWLKDVRAIEIK